MNSHPVWPEETLADFNRIASQLGWGSKRVDAKNSRWKLIALLLSYADAHPDLFRKR